MGSSSFRWRKSDCFRDDLAATDQTKS
jgi:hypothetical protein